jgi:lipopolysaccharide/colanic/teichoic acid biosynthesis glycosyltransferase
MNFQTGLTVGMRSQVALKARQSVKQKWTLATYLHPAELEALQSQINESGYADLIHIHPCIPFDTNGSSPRLGETLVISRQSVRDLKNYGNLVTAHLQGQRIVDVWQLLKEMRGRIHLGSTDAWSYLMGSTYQSPSILFYFYLKGLFEPMLALMLLALLSPLLLGVALAIFLTSGRPILYCQKRLGHRRKPFSLFKFRTMSLTAESSGAQWAIEHDPRVTRLGRWLRESRMDELPQILNVLFGELSFVGPRPERAEFYKLLNDPIPLFSMRLLVRPGITGWAQVKNGYAATVEECKTKLEYDLYYIQRMSPGMDFNVILKTLKMVVRGHSGR